MFLKSQEIRHLNEILDNAMSYTHFYRKEVITEEIPS
jgi:hypothetical protein